MEALALLAAVAEDLLRPCFPAHRPDGGKDQAASTSDDVPDFTEPVAATFVYAGIDVTNTPLFIGARGAQLAGRATLIECGPLPARLGNKQPFTDTITDLENALDLERHRPGSLPRHATYLHQRTAGRIGSLTRLIRRAAITAMHDGTEHITNAIRLDHHAETTHPPRTRTPNRQSTR
ncbi:ATP/GTP-binding protein [Streptomyces sp. NPDC046876]|uniref:ATP/GTP-binding protein n=1 Tax=Streptomyces sp. NPDC046876 TaxID=3155616 RepID=UPI003409C5DD